MCCYGVESEVHYCYNDLYQQVLTKEQIIIEMEKSDESYTWILRSLGYFLLFLGWYEVFWSCVLILSYIPFIGHAQGAIFVLYVFLTSLASYLLFLGMIWMFARPIKSTILISAFVFLIIIITIMRSTYTGHHISNNNGNFNHNGLTVNLRHEYENDSGLDLHKNRFLIPTAITSNIKSKISNSNRKTSKNVTTTIINTPYMPTSTKDHLKSAKKSMILTKRIDKNHQDNKDNEATKKAANKDDKKINSGDMINTKLLVISK